MWLIVAGFLASSAACDGFRDVNTPAGVVENVECVGFGKKQDPRFEYEIDTRNAVWSLIGSVTAIPAIVWALEYAYCPTSVIAPTIN